VAEKDTQLAITIRAVDRATAIIRAINAKIAAVAKPTMGVFKDIGTAIGATLSRIASVIGGVLDKIPLVGAAAAGLVGGAVAGLMHLVNKFDDLGDKAERFGVSVDFLASMRYAAEKAGAPVEALDAGLMTFSVNMGKLSANTGRFKKFLDLVSPALGQQLKKAKSNEAAFYLLAAAMDKLKDPAKRAALAAAAGLGPELAPLLAKGEQGVKQLSARFIDLAGSQEDAAAKAGDVDDSMHDLHASIQGAEAAIVSGLAPALKIIVGRLSEWFVAHRADIAEWAKNFGEKLPGAIKAVVEWVGQAIEKLGKFFGILGDIYDKMKEIWEWNDAHEQAKKAADQVAASVPLEKQKALADDIEQQGILAESSGSSGWSALAGLLGVPGPVADSEVGRNFVRKLAGVSGGNPTQADNIYTTGKYQRELAKQIRDQAAAAQNWRPPTEADVFGAAPGDSQAPGAAKITVDFANVPRGTRVQTDPGSTADVDLNVGYQMVPGVP
jgi:hypothetical protein